MAWRLWMIDVSHRIILRESRPWECLVLSVCRLKVGYAGAVAFFGAALTIRVVVNVKQTRFRPYC